MRNLIFYASKNCQSHANAADEFEEATGLCICSRTYCGESVDEMEYPHYPFQVEMRTKSSQITFDIDFYVEYEDNTYKVFCGKHPSSF